MFIRQSMRVMKDDIKSPSDALSELHRRFLSLNLEVDSYFTMFYGIYNRITHEFRYVNAGHECPYIYRKGEKYTLHMLEPGFILAGMEDMTYETGCIQINPGDKIFQFTDGVTDAININEELYGEQRLYDVLNKNVDKNSKELLNAIKTDIDSFVGEAAQFDDITMLCVEYLGK